MTLNSGRASNFARPFAKLFHSDVGDKLHSPTDETVLFEALVGVSEAIADVYLSGVKFAHDYN